MDTDSDQFYLYFMHGRRKRCKTQTHTKIGSLGVTVAMVAEAKDGKIGKVTYFEGILKGFAD